LVAECLDEEQWRQTTRHLSRRDGGRPTLSASMRPSGPSTALRKLNIAAAYSSTKDGSASTPNMVRDQSACALRQKLARNMAPILVYVHRPAGRSGRAPIRSTPMRPAAEASLRAASQYDVHPLRAYEHKVLQPLSVHKPKAHVGARRQLTDASRQHPAAHVPAIRLKVSTMSLDEADSRWAFQ